MRDFNVINILFLYFENTRHLMIITNKHKRVFLVTLHCQIQFVVSLFQVTNFTFLHYNIINNWVQVPNIQYLHITRKNKSFDDHVYSMILPFSCLRTGKCFFFQISIFVLMKYKDHMNYLDPFILSCRKERKTSKNLKTQILVPQAMNLEVASYWTFYLFFNKLHNSFKDQ